MPNPLDISNIPAPRVDFIDPRTGLMAREWYRFFFNLFNLTGAGTNDTSLSDLQVGPPAINAVLGELGQVYDQAQIASMMAQYEQASHDVQNQIDTAPSAPELGTLASQNADNVRLIGFSTSPSPAVPNPAPTGTLYWDGNSTLGIQMNQSVLAKIGQGQFVYVKASAAITKGQLCKHTGAVGGSGVITSAPTSLSMTDTTQIIGVAAQDIALNDFGFVQVAGDLRGFNTTGSSVGETWADGDPLYYNPSYVGSFTNVKPSAPNLKTYIGEVIAAGPGGSGSINIHLVYGSTLGGTDSNVQLGALTNKDLIQYDSVLGYWKNVAASSIAIGTATNLAGGTTGSVPYQSGASTTTFLPIGTAAQVLQVNAGATAPEWVSSTGTGNVVRATSPTLVTPALGTPSSGNFSTGTFTWPTFNQNTTGSAAKWTTARTLAGNSVDGSANVAFANKFIVQGTTDAGLSGAQFLGALGTGLLKNTTTTGVLSVAVAATDYVAPSAYASANGLTMATSRLLGRTTALSGAAEEISVSGGLTLSGGVLTGTSGTVTAVSVSSANGFAGTSSGGATPALTLSTTVTGVLKGNGTAISAATAGTDYSAGTGALATGILESTATTGALSIAVAADFPTLNQNTTGTAAGLSATLVATSGGTRQSSYAVGDLLYASTTTALSKLADVATGNALISGGVGVAPSWGKIGLATHVSGTLPVANGGTGTTTAFTLGSVLFAGASGVYSQNNAQFLWDNTNNRLGIGTAIPAAKLHVFGGTDTTFSPNVYNTRLTGDASATSGNSGSGISFQGYVTGTTSISDLAFISGIKENTTDTNYAGALVFGTRTNGSGGGNFERMRILSSGNVGIGAATPSQKLTVIGNQFIAGTNDNTYAPASITITNNGLNGTFGGSPASLLVGIAGAAINTGVAYLDTSRGGVGAAVPIAFKVDGSESMRITTAGNVGIATASPSTKLDVKNTTTGSAIRATVTDGAGSTDFGYGFYIDNTAHEIAAVNAVYTTSLSGGSGALTFKYRNAGTLAEGMRLSQLGNVGIGSASPTVKLDVTGAAAFSTSATTPIVYGGTGTTSALNLRATSGVGTTNSDIIFGVGNNGATEAMRVLNSGFVGIGTTAPSALLEVSNSTGQFNYVSTVATAGGSSGAVYFGQRARGIVSAPTAVLSGDMLVYFSGGGYNGTNFTASRGYMAVYASENWTGPANGTDIAFSVTPTGSTTAAEKMRLTGAGNLGIGRTPTYTLDVNSTARFNSTLAVGNTAPSSSGAGISFPATQSASTDVNTLDDYEEGDFTPTIQGLTTPGTGTYSVQVGKYTKIGRSVTVNLQVAWSAHTGAGAMLIAGLPFVSENVTNAYAAVSIGYANNITYTAGATPMFYIGPNRSYMNAQQMPSGGGAMATVTITTSGTYIVSATYFTTT